MRTIGYLKTSMRTISQEMNENADETVTSVGHSTRLRSSQTKQALEDMSPEERKRSDALDMRCLMLCIAMLERVNSVRSLSVYKSRRLTNYARRSRTTLLSKGCYESLSSRQSSGRN
jgi:hypothetical protein